jgi:hypothetical protein
MYSTRATKSGTHCPQYLTHSFICTLMVFWECAGNRCVHLRDLGAADLNMSLLPPVGGPCRRPDVPLTVCRVLPAAGTSLHGWPLAAGNFDQWLADHLWLPWVCCTLLVVAPTPELLQRPCITQDGAQSAVRTPAPFSTTLRWRANNLQPLVQLWRDRLRSAE